MKLAALLHDEVWLEQGEYKLEIGEAGSAISIRGHGASNFQLRVNEGGRKPQAAMPYVSVRKTSVLTPAVGVLRAFGPSRGVRPWTRSCDDSRTHTPG